MKTLISLTATLAVLATSLVAMPVVSYRVPAKLKDSIVAAEPSQVRIDGWIGRRIDANTFQRLLQVDTVPLLAGFKHKPGSHPWIGEHVGKWLHAATLAWDYSQDPKLRAKLDAVAAELIAAQEPDGYLGTYVPEKRFGLYDQANWDVWSHKYCIIGLLTYYRYTGNTAALDASKRAADLLLRVFPAQKSILAAGTHEGMAATSVLEPIVELYRLTGDARYLAFGEYILRAYDEPGGPAIVRTLLTVGHVNRVGNAKAYEMLSNLVGIVELARVTGNADLVKAVSTAWNDIVERRLYLTGSASTYELFPGDHELYNGEENHIGETCVTTTWIQLSRSLLLLTGDAKYATELERSYYNHLTAAQRPDGQDWCYYTPLEGKKPYDKDITCCHSSGPRGLALFASTAYLASDDTVYVNTVETSRARLKVSGREVGLALESKFPETGNAVLRFTGDAPAMFAVRMHVPVWGAPLKAGDRGAERGWLEIPAREWKPGDSVTLAFTLEPKLVDGTYTNYGRMAYTYGPFVLAVDRSLNPRAQPLPSIRVLADRPLKRVSSDPVKFTGAVWAQWVNEPRDMFFIPFADAGASNQEFRVWLRKM